MTSQRQIVLAAALVVGAAGLAVALTRGEAAGPGAGGGHDHAAMSAADEQRPVRLTREMERRIGVTYATAEEGSLERRVRAVGTVTYDERRLVSLNPKIEGWVEELFVDYTGARVEKGDPMLRLYSPELVAAQEELLLARRLKDRTERVPASRADENAAALLEAARRRLAYWDVPEDEIRRLEATGEPRKGLLLRAPASGVVVEKHAQEGARVVPGAPLFHVADLSTVWLEAEVFEKDLSLIRGGEPAAVSLEAYPGETFEGRVTYVYPTVSMETRTGRIRLEMSNPDGRLKPGMYATVRLVVPARRSAVTVPQTAVLNTGERSLVFVRREDGALVPREVVTGLAADDRLEVLEGLRAGETVVSSSAFLIDAESSLGAAMQAMADSGGTDHEGHGDGGPAADAVPAGSAGHDSH